MLRKAFRILSKQKKVFRGLEMPLKGVRGDQNLDGSGHESARNDHFRGPEMNNRGAVELFRRLRKVSKGLKRVRKRSECIERVQKVFRGQKPSFEDKKCHSKWPKRMASRRLMTVSECQLSGVN